jgi:hypothetical protein
MGDSYRGRENPATPGGMSSVGVANVGATGRGRAGRAVKPVTLAKVVGFIEQHSDK